MTAKETREGANNSDDQVVTRLAGLARGAVDRRLQDPRGDDELSRLLQATRPTAAAVRTTRRRGWLGLGLGLTAVGACAALLAGALRSSTPVTPVLSYARQPVAPGAAAPASGFQFSDGTTIAADADAAVDVEAVDRQRPRVRIKNHVARVHVVHRPDTRWTFLAGPFEVQVTGTSFELGWEPAQQRMSLSLLEGAVIVRGPQIPGGAMPVHAGQRVQLSAQAGPLPTGAAPAPAGAATTAAAPEPAAPDEAPPASPSVPAAAPAAPAPAAHRAGPGIAWRDLVGKGDFDGVIRQARKRSLDDCEARCAADDLRALGDAARYSNRSALAERAFLALRRRFAGTPDGAAAAYLLGRTYETRRSWRDAKRFYALSLQEAPSGEFAVEAASGHARVAARR